jgi:ABC-type uncharacterized transport system ATPase subunit
VGSPEVEARTQRPELLLEAVSIVKRFGPLTALDQVSASFRQGEIHAVLGENGAGKSTLMNILSGTLEPDAGEVRLAKGASIGMVHQHFMLVPEFSVAENLELGSQRGFWKGEQATQKALAIAEDLGWAFDPTARTGDLPVGVQQRIEILKALITDAPILVFDEPTAVLGPAEVDDLFRVLRDLRGQGRAVILIAHKLSEILAIADRITVLRRGKLVASALRQDVEARTLAEWMVGEWPELESQSFEVLPGESLVVSQLSAKGDRGETAVDHVDFSVQPGEIMGIGGVDGNGQVELAESLAGIRPHSGSVRLGSDEVNRVAYIPQDRQRDGLALSMSIAENFAIAGHRLSRFRKGWVLDRTGLRRWANELIDRFSIKAGSLDDPIRSLSGGNQQKVVVSRSLELEPQAIVAVNPTRGLDVRATADVHAALRSQAAKGIPIVLISTDLDELAAVASRTAFLSKGRLSHDASAESLVGGSV